MGWHSFFFGRRRTTYALLIAAVAAVLVGGLGRATFLQQAGVLAWKLLLVSVAVVVSHVLRRQLFHYVDLSAILDREANVKDGLIFLGIVIFYCTIILALTQGL